MELKERLKTIFVTIIGATAIYCIVKSVLLFGFSKDIILVSGSSMYPTYKNEQLIFPTRLDQKSPWGEYITIEDLVHNDVVIASADGHRDIIKRLIGLPGDTVEITSDGHICVNGAILDMQDTISDIPQQTCWKLGADEYFLLGDNINNSHDSRATGPVSGRDIKNVYR